jgi:hypothetical protein
MLKISEAGGPSLKFWNLNVASIVRNNGTQAVIGKLSWGS